MGPGRYVMRRAVVAPVIATLAAAALLSGAAVVTVQQAGCDDPGQYVQYDGGYELVGGCLEPGDLPVGPAPAIDPDARRDSPSPRP
jgi:hypothetical protein